MDGNVLDFREWDLSALREVEDEDQYPPYFRIKLNRYNPSDPAMLDIDCKRCAEIDGKKMHSVSFNVYVPGSKSQLQGSLFMINHGSHGYVD